MIVREVRGSGPSQECQTLDTRFHSSRHSNNVLKEKAFVPLSLWAPAHAQSSSSLSYQHQLRSLRVEGPLNSQIRLERKKSAKLRIQRKQAGA
ncbi:hypothetical protein Moror_2344 [Moniliophthora roreri MCA 2997]|uniref:Uncharacterized protein n=1 Tax=Moniliophthora roreri (strain MCA 2997) TaxID=1381753 RepID=V2WWA6_MONRO|nr:hypothetical protein Moror_2344 [Moniliophthora roreri MCA 2997]